jgi:hypothetical protein
MSNPANLALCCSKVLKQMIRLVFILTCCCAPLSRPRSRPNQAKPREAGQQEQT